MKLSDSPKCMFCNDDDIIHFMLRCNKCPSVTVHKKRKKAVPKYHQ